VTVGEDFQDAIHVWSAAARSQLAVAESTRAPFAEEIVALGVKRSSVVELANAAS
jgi:hypothetical protein